MTARTTQLNTGGTITVRESVLRGAGPVGPKGPQGDPGISVAVKGYKDTAAEIFAMGNTNQVNSGHAWYALDTKMLYVWYRDEPDYFPGNWATFGPVQGTPGYLNSVGARLVANSTEVIQSVVSGGSTRLRWRSNGSGAYIDNEFIENMPTAIPIIGTYSGTPTAPANAVDDVDMIQTKIPAAVYDLNYPESVHPAAYLLAVTCEFEPSVATRGEFTLQVVRRPVTGTEEIVAQSTTYTFDKRQNVTVFTLIRGTTDFWEVRATATNTAGSIKNRRLEFIRAGGGPGPQGPRGDVGPAMRAHPESPVANETALAEKTGQEGEAIYVTSNGTMYIWQDNDWKSLGFMRGDHGDANGGFNYFNGLIGNEADPPDSDQAADDVATTTSFTDDQEAPYPKPLAEPRVPYWLKRLGQWAETRIVSRFATDADRNTARPTPEEGEVSYLGSAPAATRGLSMYTGDNGVNQPTYLRVPTVVVSTSDAPSANVTYPDGTLWVKV